MKPILIRCRWYAITIAVLTASLASCGDARVSLEQVAGPTDGAESPEPVQSATASAATGTPAPWADLMTSGEILEPFRFSSLLDMTDASALVARGTIEEVVRGATYTDPLSEEEAAALDVDPDAPSVMYANAVVRIDDVLKGEEQSGELVSVSLLLQEPDPAIIAELGGRIAGREALLFLRPAPDERDPGEGDYYLSSTQGLLARNEDSSLAPLWSESGFPAELEARSLEEIVALAEVSPTGGR